MPDQHRAGFRPEIQGLRAVAVVSVLIYHLLPEALPGGFVGVDVFFVISGFLITEVLLRDVRATGSISMLRFYGRRIKRLLPAATVVILASAFCYSLLPAVNWGEHAEQITASTLYYQNWWLGLQAVDYLAAEHAPGPLQHFWSLSVEEQYYFVWPLMFLAVSLLLRNRRKDPATVLRWTIALVFLASLAHSVHYSHAEPGMAYFASTTRAWELALGGLLATLSNRIDLSGTQRFWLSLGGLLLILVSFFWITPDSIFPGYIALMPTLGTAAVIAAGDLPGRLSAQRLLATAPFQYLGDISYSLYLWHWPVIIFLQKLTGHPLTLLEVGIAAAVSCALAHQTKVLIEDPFRQIDYLNLGNRWPLLLGLICIALSIASALYVNDAYRRAMNQPAPVTTKADGAVSLPVEQAVSDYTPTPLQAREDLPRPERMGCDAGQAAAKPRLCTFGDTTASTRLALVGDSHARQWSQAFQEIAEANGWSLTVITKSACAFAPIVVSIGQPARPYETCYDWYEAVQRELSALDPTHVIIGQSIGQTAFGTRDRIENSQAISDAYATAWKKLTDRGIEVLVIKDTPRMAVNVPECLSSPGNTISSCSRARSEVLDRPTHPDPLVFAAEKSPDVQLLDLNDHICHSDICPAVQNGMLVWRDSHHLTNTYALSLKPVISKALEDGFGLTVKSKSETSTNDSDTANALHFSEKDLANARLDLGPLHRDRCINGKIGHQLKVCSYGNPEAEMHVLLAGDTRAGQWAPALIELRNSHDLRISTLITYACPLGDLRDEKRDCAAWTEALVRSISELNPDVIFISQSRGYRMPDTAIGLANATALASEFLNAIRPLRSSPSRLIVIPDTPRFSFDANACLADRPEEPLLACSTDVKRALPGVDRPDPLLLVADRSPDIEVLELNDAICPPTGYVCLPASNDKLIWQSRYLITASFSETLADRFSKALFPE